MKPPARTTRRFLTYQVVLSPESDRSAYNVSVPALPGCLTFGEDVQEALAMAKEAMELTIESILDDGERLPQDTGRPVALGPDDLLAHVTIQLPYHVSKAARTDRPRARASA